MAVNKTQLDKDIEEMFPIQKGETYFYGELEVVVLEEVADGFNVKIPTGETVLAPKGSLKTQAELNLEK